MANEGGSQGNNTNKFYAKNTERLWTSWLVPLIVVAHIAVFVVVMYINNCPNKEDNGFVGSCVAKFLGRFSFQPLKDNPLFGPSSSTLTKMGALEFYKIVHRHQVWRLITSMWLHAGVIHLLANVLSLAFIGIRLEQQFGFVRVGIIYLLSGVGGNILSCIFLLQGRVSVGASYALSGLLGAMLSELITNWTLYSNKAAALITLIFMIAINLSLGIFPHVGNFGHIGGLLSGFLIGFVLLLRPKFGWVDSRLLPEKAHVKPKYKAHQYVFGVVGLVLLTAGFAVSLVVLFKSEHGKDLCSWCHNLSCVRTSKWTCDG